MKKLLKVIFIVFLIFMLAVIGGAFYLTRGLSEGSKLTINEIKPSLLSDGSYNGSYNSGRWSNKLKVTVKDGKITEIQVVKDVTFPESECTVELFKKVIEKQSTKVDAVSGATVTSKAYLKSIENALNK